MLFKNLFGHKPQAQKEETVSMEEKVMENKEEKTNGMTSVYHLIVLDESGWWYIYIHCLCCCCSFCECLQHLFVAHLRK